MDFFKSCLDQLSRDLIYLILYFQGEPYIHPRFLEMVKYASSRDLYTITSTNGHFLDSERARQTVESGLDRLIISVDGSTQDTYEQYRRGGDLDKVLDGARNLVHWKKQLRSSKPYIIFQFLVVRPNEHQIGEIKSLAKEIGVDEVKLKSAQVYEYVNGNPLIPTIEKYSRYEKQADGSYKLKHRVINQCWKMWHSCVVTWDGHVVPCCFDKDADHQLGSLSKSNFKEIWESENYRSFRSRILTGRDNIDICQNCTEGCKVWVQ